MIEKKISVNTINGLLKELNCNTRIRKINPKAISNAIPKKLFVSASCSPCPVCLMVTSEGIGTKVLNLSILVASSLFTLAVIDGSKTFDCN